MIFSTSIVPCSTFSIEGKEGSYLGRSLDFPFGHGLAIVNKRNVIKMGLPSQTEYMKYAAEWKSRYGSVTFNQIARELPYGGMNEKGLVVEQMWLIGGGFAKPDGRPAVNELQWMQYQLDNFATVTEVIENIHKVQIVSTASELHYMFCDAGRDCALIDYIAGKPVIYHGKSFPLRVSTNTPYDVSLKNETRSGMAIVSNFGWNNSVDRFQILKKHTAENSIKMSEEAAVDYVFKGLDKVHTKNAVLPFMLKVYAFFAGMFSKATYSNTQWQIVYNTQNNKIYFKNATDEKYKKIDLSRFDFSCNTPVKTYDLAKHNTGDIVGKFKNYERDENARIVNASLDGWEDLPQQGRNFLIEYPEKLLCEETK